MADKIEKCCQCHKPQWNWQGVELASGKIMCDACYEHHIPDVNRDTASAPRERQGPLASKKASK